MKPTHRAILETAAPAVTASSTVIGSRVNHRNAPERVGIILSEVGGQCVVEYVHDVEAGATAIVTHAHYPLAELTIVP